MGPCGRSRRAHRTNNLVLRCFACRFFFCATILTIQPTLLDFFTNIEGPRGNLIRNVNFFAAQEGRTLMKRGFGWFSISLSIALVINRGISDAVPSGRLAEAKPSCETSILDKAKNSYLNDELGNLGGVHYFIFSTKNEEPSVFEAYIPLGTHCSYSGAHEVGERVLKHLARLI